MQNRRQFLQCAALGVAGLSALSQSRQCQATQQQPPRSLHLYNIHTGESVNTVFWADGQYLDDETQQLDRLMRDHRANESIAMQHRLYEQMHQLQSLFNSKLPMNIISAYRSPDTNARLRRLSSGVASRSLHTQGKAVDIRIPGVSHRELHRAALAMSCGGVGYYPESGFIHLDTGRVRSWGS